MREKTPQTLYFVPQPRTGVDCLQMNFKIDLFNLQKAKWLPCHVSISVFCPAICSFYRAPPVGVDSPDRDKDACALAL